MVTPPDIEAQILRYYHAEKWRVGTIAGQLHVHHSVVTRVLAQAGLPRIGPPARPSQIDAYLPFIRQTLDTFPTLTASRLYVMVRERGYRGSPDHFRHVIACHRPRPKAEAYLRLRCLPGEQAQVDWGHFGHLEIGRARRPLMAFVMVLSHARQIFLRFFPDARMENFLRGHVAAFTAWHGVPRVACQTTISKAWCWNGAATRSVSIRPCWALPGNIAMNRAPWRSRAVTKKVASSAPSDTPAMRFLLPDASKISMTSMPRPRSGATALPPTDAAPMNLTARSARCSLRKWLACCRCPTILAPLLEHVAVTVGKTPYVRFDLNDYSVPHNYVRRALTVLADPHEVRIVDGAEVLACHRRSYDKGAQIEDVAHVQRLVEQKRAAHQHRATDRLAQAAPRQPDPADPRR